MEAEGAYRPWKEHLDVLPGVFGVHELHDEFTPCGAAVINPDPA